MSPNEELRGKRILVVDDQSTDATAILLKTVLNVDIDKLCTFVGSGKEAIEKVVASTDLYGGQNCGFKLILMDCNMPMLDGYQTTSTIREFLFKNEITQPIISAITGHTQKIYVDKAMASGMNQVLTKPIDP